MRKILMCILLFAFSVSILLVQRIVQIKGRVADKKTGGPIPFASVYFNNTSIGTITDSAGNYYLKNIPIDNTDLAFSSIGYEYYVKKLSLASEESETYSLFAQGTSST